MTVKELSQKLNCKIIAGNDGTNREIENCYIGDLLSFVMGKAQENDVWLTVMGNVNAIAVAVLADISCILLVENSTLDDDAKQKADVQQVAILQSEETSYNLAIKIYNLLQEEK